jgi:N-acetylmuramoyl-L-alanine amidase
MNTYTQDSFFAEDEPLEEPMTETESGQQDSREPAPDDAPSENAETPAQDVVSTVEEQPQAADTIEARAEASDFFEPTQVMGDPGQDAVDAFFGPVRLDRPRLERPSLIPRWVWIALASVVGVMLIAVGAWAWSTRLANIAVPSLTGIDVGVARTRLASKGLDLTISEERFSAQPAQVVLAQDPSAGTMLRRGTTVAVVVSAGTEQFSMPDVVGNGLLLARGRLETKGLDVRVDPQPSQQPSDTVLASNPPAGKQVHTGDIVRLTVAAPGPKTQLLLPYDMTGVTVVLDPAPVNDALGDVPLDIARRVRSLVEASHGVVRTTRALADTSTLEAAPARARRAGNGSATVAVGLSASTVGSGGIVVFSPSPILPRASQSAKLASRITSDLATEAGTVSSSTSSTDTVLAAAKAPWTRVQLGSYASREDTAKFADPNWEDTVARAIYRSLGSLYGQKPPGT